MGASFGAEVLKLRKRPATWVLLLVLVAAMALFGYVFNYFLTVQAQGPPQEIKDATLQYLLPKNVLVNVTSNLAIFGSSIALILGALTAGSEYGWETIKTTLTQKPSRIAVLVGKTVAVSVILLVFTLVAFTLSAVSSYFIANAQDVPANWPSFGEWLKAIGAGWLILSMFAAMGIFLATLFRGTALAIGLGLVYLLVLEGLFVSLAPQSDTAQNIAKALPGQNATSLADSFGNVPQALATQGQTVDAMQSALVIGAYTVGFIVLAVILFRQRDMT